jgi:phospholipid/cholesterol/gamma-HCH transport system substrate-binding protein
METRANFVLLGGFTLIAVVLAFLFSLWLAGDDWSKTYSEYDVVFEGPVRGIARNGEVRFNGIKVGEVVDLRLDPSNANRVLARIRIDAATPVKTDSDAQVEPIGVTGLNLIQISAGTDAGAPLKPEFGRPRPQIPARPGQFEAILASGEEIARQAAETLAKAQSLLTTENTARFERILINIEKVSAQLASDQHGVRAAGEAATALRDAAVSINRTAQSLTAFTDDSRSQLATILQETGVLVDTSNAAMADVGQAARSIESVLGTATPDIAAAAQELRQLSETLQALAADVNDSPTAFLAGEARPRVRVAP